MSQKDHTNSSQHRPRSEFKASLNYKIKHVSKKKKTHKDWPIPPCGKQRQENQSFRPPRAVWDFIRTKQTKGNKQGLGRSQNACLIVYKTPDSILSMGMEQRLLNQRYFFPGIYLSTHLLRQRTCYEVKVCHQAILWGVGNWIQVC